ncbi:unnamed protein product [Candidula unifasciata]|uniref:Uncharacterized protein n=1 Tax=Candidula unifasciata TaxID=100452 RepID=A0A8S4A4Z4_9EUPU|nr:unnamed protein product [Candidula unifasciata]
MMFLTVIVLVVPACYFVCRFLHSLKIDGYTEKYIFITGCDTGFGRELAIHLDSLGFNVFAGCLTKDGAQSLSAAASSRLTTVPLDITKPESVQEALRLTQQRLPKEKGIWALVNNAGVLGNLSPLELCTRDDFTKVLTINLLGPTETIRAFLPLVRKSKGRIVNITSAFGRFAGFGAPYCASKFGLEGLTDVLRREVYHQGIKVSIIEPGGFPTSIGKTMNDEIIDARDRASPEVKKQYELYLKQFTSLTATATPTSSSLRPVIDAYTHAIVSRYPHTRYVVGTDARFVFIPLSYLPDWMSDLVLRLMAKFIS